MILPDGKHGEVSLQARIYGETTRGRIHARYVLRIVDLL